jgi:hypothetical protein
LIAARHSPRFPGHDGTEVVQDKVCTALFSAVTVPKHGVGVALLPRLKTTCSVRREWGSRLVSAQVLHLVIKVREKHLLQSPSLPERLGLPPHPSVFVHGIRRSFD